MMRRKRNRFRMLLCMAAVCVSGVLIPTSVRAGTLYESPYVSFSSDRYAWTVKENIANAPLYYKLKEDKPDYWYPKGEKVETEIKSTLRALNEGEHYYAVERSGEVPIKYWEVEWSAGKCIHDCIVENWHGIQNVGMDGRGEHCNRTYYSGWTAYCADCGGKLNTSIVYMSRAAARTITSVDTGKGYYYVCPSCKHIENTMGPISHECQDISFNQYRVVYDKNDGGTGTVGGLMDPSYHMYNNEDVYRGLKFTPNGHLSKNVYTRTGYVFTGWNTKKNGSGTAYEDCAEILNLSKYNYEDDNQRGTVTLYAQWKQTKSTLQIKLKGGTYNDPVLKEQGGTYNKTTGVVTLKKTYGESYHAKQSYVTPPSGWKVTFKTNGGEKISPITQQKSFGGWTQTSGPFAGRMKDNVYVFVGADGSMDVIEATYKDKSITLPEAKKDGSSFGGWYSDEECITLVGFAGDKYTASENTTLYAKWVELLLSSEQNYSDNGGKGAVDLSWSQPDGKNKNYKVYLAKGGGDFSLISGAGDDMDAVTVSRTFDYKEEYEENYKKETYIIPYNGFYELSASGAQGSGYGEFSGGKGGKVTARFYLSAGEKLTIALGGQGKTADDQSQAAGGKGGYGGGKGNQYGSGGGATTITSNLQGVLLVAGGGGGASPAGNGGKGGSTESLRTDKVGNGGGGQAGGGGGHVGGNSGKRVTHTHADDCYKEEDLSYDFKEFAGYTSFTSEHMYNLTDKIEDMCSAGTGLITVGGHTKNNNDNNANFIIKIGTKDKPISTKNNTKLTIPFYLYTWGEEGYLTDNAFLNVYNQKGQIIKTFKLADCYTTIEEKNGSHHCKIVKNASTNTPYEFEVNLPEGTTGIYIGIKLTTNHKENNSGGTSGTWVDAQVKSLEFSGGVTKTKICGYTEGQVLSSKPAYGGSNYINDAATYVETDSSGMRSGNGRASIQSDTIGFLTELSLKGVPAPDEKGPTGISTASDKLTLKAEGQNGVAVTFRRPADMGTRYQFKVESYEKGSGDVLCESNKTQETLQTGVAGYYYILNATPEKEVTENNADNKRNMLLSTGTTQTLNVELTKNVMYLHIAAVDKAGNVGTTSHITLKRKLIPGGVATGQITVTDSVNGRTYGSVYHKTGKTYYVRADGETPFLLSFPSYLEGVASPNYQIDYQIFDVTMDSKHQWYSTRIPISSPVRTEEELKASDFIREMTGDSILRDAMNTSAVRKQSATENHFAQAFTLPATCHGKNLQVTPVAGVTNNIEGTTDKGEIVYSDWSDDSTHSLKLIADGEGPVITGMELLESWKGSDRNGGILTLNVSASDGLSGVKEFYVEVTNRDNDISKVYRPVGGVIKVKITEEDSVFTGDFVVTAYAVDHVGNETTVSGSLSEFALSAVVERILAPHEPLFKRGESGILSITVKGYAEKVEVEFPEVFVLQNPELNQTWYPDASQYKWEEALRFMVPLEALAEEYKVTVRAYKNGQVLEECPELYVIGTGSVTEELRTRLR